MIKTAATFPPSEGQNLVGSVFKILQQGRARLYLLCCGTGIPQSLRSGSFGGFFLMLHDTLDPKPVNPKFPPCGHYK